MVSNTPVYTLPQTRESLIMGRLQGSQISGESPDMYADQWKTEFLIRSNGGTPIKSVYQHDGVDFERPPPPLFFISMTNFTIRNASFAVEAPFL